MCKGSVEGGRASGQEEEGDEGEAGSPDQSFDCATTRKRSLLSDAGGSCGGGEGGACRRIFLRGMRVGDRGRGGVPSPRTAGKPPPAPGGGSSLGQPLRESFGQRRRTARRGGVAAGRVFAQEPEPRQGGGGRPSPRPTTSPASGASTRLWRRPEQPRREGVGRVPRLSPQDH